MVNRMLLIGENISSFILSSIKEGLKENGYEVSGAKLNLNELNNLKEQPTHILIYAGDYIDTATDALVFLRDYCVEHEINVSLVGYQTEITTLKKFFTNEIVNHVFERPLNVKELIDKLQEDAQSSQKEGLKKHILVVDDSGTMLRTIKSWLQNTYKVSIASSATMAISFLATNKPDLILLDYEMPICDGPHFLEMIRAEVETRDIPVIFLTAKGDRESVQSVLALKPAGYLLKTMAPGDVVKNIDDFFEKQKKL